MAKPMYNKYFDAWNTYVELYGSKTAVLYQVGGFFEIYDIENLTTGTTRSNIREIAEICQISLSIATISDTEQSLFGGFPDHALPKYEKILVSAGFTVVVIVQKKGRNGTVESRIVDHISSPGCWAEGTRERSLVGVLLESMQGTTYWSAASFTAVTGTTYVAEGSDNDRLHQFLCTYQPSELILWTDGHAAIDSLKKVCDTVHLKCLAAESHAVDEAILSRFWKKEDYESLRKLPQSRRVLAALMDFAQGHNPLYLKNLISPHIWCSMGEVRLGNAALEQLGVISLKEEKHSLLGLMDTCKTAAGRRALRQRLLRPISDISELQSRRNEFQNIPKDFDTSMYLRRIYDTSKLFRKVELGSATLNDMACLMRSYEASLSLLKNWRPEMADGIGYLETTLESWDVDLLTEVSSDTIPLKIPRKNAPSNITQTLAEGQTILAKARELCGNTKGESLYLDTTDGLRFCGNKRTVSSVCTYLKDRGDTTATILPYKTYWTLETAEIHSLISAFQTWYARWIDVWITYWKLCLTELHQTRPFYSKVEAACASIDIIFSVSAIATDWGWSLPDYVESDEGYLEVVEIRHPMIEQIHTKVPYVTQNIILRESGLLLFGLNASGKSSLMKAIGLCTILAQTGFPVPATSFKLAPFSAIFTRILGNDNLWSGQSSFAVEMSEFREVLQYSDNQTLVLGDELCSGTETISATAIVAAGLETLASRRTKFLFATHLHELGSMTISGVRIAHLAVHYDDESGLLIYDRTLREGSGSALYGLEVCKAMGLSSAFLERAHQIRKGLIGNQNPRLSTYSKDSVKESCEVCGSTTALESHHIHHQATFQGPEKSLHASHNLTTLCSICHDEHHRGHLIIQGWEETSEGRRLRWSKIQPELLTPEVTAFIRLEKGLKKPLQTIIRVVEQHYGVKVTTKQIRLL